MPTSPLVVSWPGGIGNPSNERIPTSGGRRKTRKSKARKVRKVRKARKTRVRGNKHR